MPTPVLALLVVAAAIVAGGLTAYCIGPPRRGCGHRGPARPYSIETAHNVMQYRIDCDVATCHDKNSAWQVLFKAGRVTPAVQATRNSRRWRTV